MRIARHFIGAALTAAAALGALSGPAAARGLHITLAVPAQANAGAPIRIVYTSVGIPKSASLVIQRQMGTSHIYRTVMTLAHSRLAAANLPALPLGIYTVRIAVISGSTVIPDPPATLHVYGPVSASQLCNEFEVGTTDMRWPWGCYPTTLQVGSTVYEAATVDQNENTTPTGPATVTATRSSCRSATITFAAPNNESFSTIGVQLTQSAADPQSATAGYGQVGTLSANLSSPDWDLEIWTDTGVYDVYWNATFMCWSQNGHT